MSSTTTAASTTTVQFVTGVQYGFFFNQARCIGCQTCVASCKSWNILSPGPSSKWLRLFQHEEGAFPDVRVFLHFVPCYHCVNPVCIPAANGAMIKEPNYGAVLIDPDQASGPNMKAAWDACPYGSILFDSDDYSTATASKCTMCIDRLEQNLMPVCVMACPERAIDFGPIDELSKKYPKASSDLPNDAGFPSSTTTSPAVLFNPMDPRVSIVPYDANAALALIQSRGSSFPPVFNSLSDVQDIPSGLVGRDHLNIKPTSNEEIQYYTQDEI